MNLDRFRAPLGPRFGGYANPGRMQRICQLPSECRDRLFRHAECGQRTAEGGLCRSRSADLRPDAREKIRVVAEEARQDRVDRAEVAGFADTVGSPSLNQQVSQRRAEAVARALEEMGVPRNEIAVNWHGESELAVRTPDNVPNPEDRRVIITVASG